MFSVLGEALAVLFTPSRPKIRRLPTEDAIWVTKTCTVTITLGDNAELLYEDYEEAEE